MKSVHYLVCERVLPFLALVFPFLLVIPPNNAQTSTITIEYSINANNRDAWSGDSHTGNPNHEVRINGYNSTNEPYEFVGNDSDAESAGMEFQLTIPQSTAIQNAFITVKAASFQNTSPTGGMEIHLYNIANAQPFADGFFGDLVDHHPTYAQTIFWNANATWTNGSIYQTPDISPLVQTFVNRADYAAGNYIGFAVTKGTILSSRYYGWEDYFANGAPAKLTVTYLAVTTPTSTTTPTPTPTNRPTATSAPTVTPKLNPTVMPSATQTPTVTPTNDLTTTLEFIPICAMLPLRKVTATLLVPLRKPLSSGRSAPAIEVASALL